MNVSSGKTANSPPIVEKKKLINITGKNILKVILGIPIITLAMGIQGLIPVLLFGLAREFYIGIISSEPFSNILLITIDLLKEPKTWLIAIVVGLFCHIKD